MRIASHTGLGKDIKISYQRVEKKDILLYLEIEKIGNSSGLYFSLKTVQQVKNFLDENVVYFICARNKVIGTISYEIKNTDRALLTGIVVVPFYQNVGVATKAMKKILEEIKHVRKIELVTHPKN